LNIVQALEAPGDDGRFSLNMLPDGLSRVDKFQTAPIGTVTVDLLGNAGVEESYGTLTHYIGEPAERFAAAGVPFLVNEIASMGLGWYVAASMLFAMSEMNRQCREGGHSWSDLATLKSRPSEAITSAKQYWPDSWSG